MRRSDSQPSLPLHYRSVGSASLQEYGNYPDEFPVEPINDLLGGYGLGSKVSIIAGSAAGTVG